MECKFKIITKLTKHIIWSASLKILYFFMHVYVNLNITTSIIIVLKILKMAKKSRKLSWFNINFFYVVYCLLEKFGTQIIICKSLRIQT